MSARLELVNSGARAKHYIVDYLGGYVLETLLKKMATLDAMYNLLFKINMDLLKKS